ncbi:hypothetical protein GIY30_06950 [Gordonia sp. HNM0687]|uniref:Peptidase MA-like domain-containing protein n=2 Tax=Gordonia mangrovi TaxID=2665643 RepID=A0A6L7GME8_9ACTN|nr:hypothetical protein [Gordonia mangrovi]
MLAAVVAGCASPVEPAASSSSSRATTTTTPVNVYEQQRASGVQRTLDELSTALRDGDANRVDALLDAATAPAFRARMRDTAVNFSGSAVRAEAASRSTTPTTPATASRAPSSPSRSRIARPSGSPTTSAPVPPRGTALRLDDFRYQVAPTTEAEILVPPDLQQRLDEQGSSDSWVAPIELRYALGGASTPGVDEPDVVVDMQLVMARYGDDWTVVGDASAIGGDPAPTQLWDLPGLGATDVSTAGGTSVIASYPDTAVVVERARELVPGSVDAVTAFWGDDWPRRAVLVATARPAEFSALARSAGTDVAAAAAATVYSRVDSDDDVAVGQRVVLTPSAARFSAAALGVVLRHELTHVAARVVTAAGAPLWITEGVPEYVGRKGTYVRFADAAPDLAVAVDAGQLPTDLPADADFAVDSDTARIAYQSAWSVAAYVADRFGEDRLRELYLGVAATDDPARQGEAIADALGISRAELVAGWRRWLTTQVR